MNHNSANQGKVFESVICKMGAIVTQPQCIDLNMVSWMTYFTISLRLVIVMECATNFYFFHKDDWLGSLSV